MRWKSSVRAFAYGEESVKFWPRKGHLHRTKAADAAGVPAGCVMTQSRSPAAPVAPWLRGEIATATYPELDHDRGDALLGRAPAGWVRWFRLPARLLACVLHDR